MKFQNDNRTNSVPWKPGTAVWASAYAYNGPKTARGLHQPPVRGLLLAARYPDANEKAMAAPCPKARYFAPFRKGSQTDVQWSRVIPVESRDFADTEQESVELYNRRIMENVAMLQGMLRELDKDLIPVGDQERDEDGYLTVLPAMRVDLSVTADVLIEAMKADMTLNDEYKDCVWEWDRFLSAVHRGDINDHDGHGDLMVDGKVSSNALLYLSLQGLYVYDEYLVPFESVPSIFAGHDLKVVWFPK